MGGFLSPVHLVPQISSTNGSYFYNSNGVENWNETSVEIACQFNVTAQQGTIVAVTMYDSSDKNAWKLYSGVVNPGALGQSPTGNPIQRVPSGTFVWIGLRYVTFQGLGDGEVDVRNWEGLDIQVEPGTPGLAQFRLYLHSPYQWQYVKVTHREVPGWGVFLLFFTCLFIVIIVGYTGYWFVVKRPKGHPYSPVL